jgi:hypothetical protein
VDSGINLDSFEEDASTDAQPTPLVRRTVIPYDDLDVANRPERWSVLSTDLISTLSILSAQGEVGPKLLSVDAAGNLRVGARVNALTRLGAALAGGATVAKVLNTSDFFPGDHVTLVQNGAPANVCTNVVIQSVDSLTQMTFVATCPAINFSVGDYVVGEQVINIRNIFKPVSIGGVGVNTAIGAPGTIDDNVMITTTVNGHRRLATDTERSYDWFGVGEGAIGAQVTVTTSAFGAGFRSVASHLFGSFENPGGAGVALYLELFNGAAGGGDRRYRVPMYVPAGASKEFVLTGVRWKSDDNGFWTWRTDRAVAGALGHMTIAGFVEG